MLTKKISCTIILLLLFLLVRTTVCAQSFSEVRLSGEGEKAYRALLTAQRFEDVAIGYGAVRSKLVEAYYILLNEPAADAKFKKLLEEATPYQR